MVSVHLTDCSFQGVKKNESLILIKNQTPLKSKYNLFCWTETGVFIVLELIMALRFKYRNKNNSSRCMWKLPLKEMVAKFKYVNQKGV